MIITNKQIENILTENLNPLDRQFLLPKNFKFVKNKLIPSNFKIFHIKNISDYIQNYYHYVSLITTNSDYFNYKQMFCLIYYTLLCNKILKQQVSIKNFKYDNILLRYFFLSRHFFSFFAITKQHGFICETVHDILSTKQIENYKFIILTEAINCYYNFYLDSFEIVNVNESKNITPILIK